MLPSEMRMMSQSDQLKVYRDMRSQGNRVASPRQLVSHLNKFRKNEEIYSTYNARLTDYYVDDTNAPKLHIFSEIMSSEGTNVWIQEIVFMTPDIIPYPEAGRIPIRVKNKHDQIVPDENWYLKPMDVDTPVKVRCSCPDFRHTFMWQDHDIGSLKGRRLKYVSTGERAPRNPDNIPGVCKHIGSLFYVLQNSSDVMRKSPQLRPQYLFRR